MKMKTLDIYIEGKATCHLVSMNLKEYLENLSEDYQDYDIQRGIVSNHYLDTIDLAIINNEYIPPITLMIEKNIDEEISNNNFKILDGLQRTFRMKKLLKLIRELEELSQSDIYKIKQAIEEDNASEFKKIFGYQIKKTGYLISKSFHLVKLLIEKCPDRKYDSVFDRKQWFEVWTNLSQEEQVKKMLILNAGHKPMSIYHQLELLFINNLSTVRENYTNVEIIRGKQTNPATYAKNRKKYQYYYPHIIESMLSFITQKPMIISSKLVRDLQEDLISKIELNNHNDLINEIISFLIKLDDILDEDYGDIGTKWISKDTVLTAMFSTISKEGTFEEFIYILKENKGILNLDNFNEMRKKIDSSSVNIGRYTRNIIEKGVIDLFNNKTGSPINWSLISENDYSLKNEVLTNGKY